MCTLIPFCLVLFLPGQVSARTEEELLADAQTAFRHGVENQARLLQARIDFSRATDAYLDLHHRGVRTSTLYRDLGNAAMLADRWPEAIWAYHMGLTLDPNDRAMREHLAFARGKVLYPAAGQGRLGAETWPPWLHRPTAFELSFIFALSYVLAWIAGTVAFLTKKPRLIVLTILAALFTILAGVAATLTCERTNADRARPLVVIADNTPFYRGNGPSYPQHAAVPILPRGLEARLDHRRGDWLQIRLTTGEVGWLPRGQVLIVEPCIE